jgi:hypothetical protein
MCRRSIYAVCGASTAGKAGGEPCRKEISMRCPESWHLAGPLAALCGLFACVHTVRRRDKALLGALLALWLTSLPGIQIEPT